MKKLSLFISAFALCSSVSYMALAVESVNCAQLPNCESLGYKDQIKYCPSRYIRCPFSETIGACLHEAAIGSVQYFPFNMDEDAKNRGWLLCDGSEYAIDKYPELYSVLGDNFCPFPSGSIKRQCTSGYFNVPNYQGYFLRVKSAGSGLVLGAGVDTNTSFATSQQAGLPDVTGSFSMYIPTSTTTSNGVSNYYPGETEGAFTRTQLNTPEIANYTLTLSGSSPVRYLHQFNFKLKQEQKDTFSGNDASAPWLTKMNGDKCYDLTMIVDKLSNKVTYTRTTCATPYGKSDGVVPQNYAVNAYIYTGKIIRMSLEDLPAPTDALYNAAHEFTNIDNITPPTFE